MATTTTTTTTTATVGGGTTVDNLNVLDSSKTNDLSGIEIITWSEVSAALFSSQNATQVQTLQSSFNAGNLTLTFQAGTIFFTISSDGAGNYTIAQTDKYGATSGFDAYSNQSVVLPPVSSAISDYLHSYNTTASFISAVNTLLLSV